MTWPADVLPADQRMAERTWALGPLRRGATWGLPRGWRYLSVGAVALAHAGVFWALLREMPDRAVPAPVRVVTVVLLADAAPPARPMPPRRVQTSQAVPPVRQAIPAPRPAPVSTPQPITAPAPAPAVQPPLQAASPNAEAAPEAPASPPVGRAAATVAPSPPGELREPRALSATQVSYAQLAPKVYPEASLRLGEAGVVQMRVLVDEHGRAAEVQIQRSSGFARLDKAASAAIRSARFNPYTEDGQAQPFWVVIPYRFNLD